VTTDALPGKSFKGTIVRLAPLLKETSRQARVEIEIPNLWEILKPGMFVRVQILFAEHEDVTVIPLTSLARRDGEQGVFLVDPVEKVAHFTPVQLGIAGVESAEVISPPLTGLVVTLGHHLLEDGSAVILPETESGDSPRQQKSTKKPRNRGEEQPGGKQ
jgi:multidrug efflux pump subunit AcrA (membrane-fusion protein)